MVGFLVWIREDASSALRGRVRHVRTGEEFTFTCAADLIGFLVRLMAAAEAPGPSRPGRAERRAPGTSRRHPQERS